MRERVSRVPLVGGRRGKATTGSDGRSILLPPSFRTISAKAVTLHDRNYTIHLQLCFQLIYTNKSCFLIIIMERDFKDSRDIDMFFITIFFT